MAPQTDPPPEIPADTPLPNPDELGWPEMPSGLSEAKKREFREKIRDSKIEVRKIRAEGDRDQRLEEVKADLALQAEFHKGVVEVAKGSIERARSGAQLIQSAATAIAGLYTGVLALAFSVSERPLPERGVIPVLFLGAAVVLAAAYLSYLTRPNDQSLPNLAGSPAEAAMKRSAFFVLWTRSGAMQRGSLLRASVIALAVGLAFLPAPFITIDPKSAAASESELTWPSTPTEVTEPKLQEVVYTAQVAEASELRKDAREPIAQEEDEGRWWAYAAVGAVLVILGPFLIGLGMTRFRRQDPEDGSAVLPDPTVAQ